MSILHPGGASLPLTVWLDVLMAVMPPRGILVVGAGNGSGPFVRWLERVQWPSVCLIEGDEQQYQHLIRSVTHHSGWTLRRDVVAPEDGAVTFYRASNSAESGLVPPDALQVLWPHLSASSTVEESAISLAEILKEDTQDINWIVLDCLPAASLLASAADLLSNVDVLICRVVVDTSAEPQHGATLSSVQNALQDLNFIPSDLAPTRHPLISHAVFVRNVAELRSSHKTQEDHWRALLEARQAEASQASQAHDLLTQQLEQALKTTVQAQETLRDQHQALTKRWEEAQARLQEQQGTLLALDAMTTALNEVQQSHREQIKQLHSQIIECDSLRAQNGELTSKLNAAHDQLQARESMLNDLITDLNKHGLDLNESGLVVSVALSTRQPQQKGADTTTVTLPPVFSLAMQLEQAAPLPLHFYAPGHARISLTEESVLYETEPKKPLYIVSNDTASFERTSGNAGIPVRGAANYVLDADVHAIGDEPIVVWVFQYRDGKKQQSTSIQVKDGHAHSTFMTEPDVDAIGLGLRVAGTGRLSLSQSKISLRRQTEAELMKLFEQRLATLQQVHHREVDNAMRQVEASVRLQHFLGPKVMLPKMHNWPISPDLGLLIVELFEQHAYTAAVEFGSGTSTVLLAKALKGSSKGGAARLLSFEHLEQYHQETQDLLKGAALSSMVRLELSPLEIWRGGDSEGQLYYSCERALSAFADSLAASDSPILVLVDGPPAATAHHARYPALPCTVEALRFSRRPIHFLMDDYIRDDEKSIVARWEAWLTQRNIQYRRTEYNQLEKQACLLEIRS